MNGSKVIEIAKKEIGVCESPKNSNLTKYGAWFGWNGVYWCGIFVSWCYAKAGYPLGNIGYLKGFAGCETAVVHFTRTGEITKNPVGGDIAFFDWGKDGKYDHTGIFDYKIDDIFFMCIEGNTGIGNDSNGGQVMHRKRKFIDAIFAHPKVLGK